MCIVPSRPVVSGRRRRRHGRRSPLSRGDRWRSPTLKARHVVGGTVTIYTICVAAFWDYSIRWRREQEKKEKKLRLQQTRQFKSRVWDYDDRDEFRIIYVYIRRWRQRRLSRHFFFRSVAAVGVCVVCINVGRHSCAAVRRTPQRVYTLGGACPLCPPVLTSSPSSPVVFVFLPTRHLHHRMDRLLFLLLAPSSHSYSAAVDPGIMISIVHGRRSKALKILSISVCVFYSWFFSHW